MKVFFVHEDIYHAGNPYIYTLAEGIKVVHPDTFEFGFGRKEFWGDEVFAYDIVHFQWPQSFIGGDQEHNAEDLHRRIDEFRKRGIKVVATCHDLKPHYNQCANGADAMIVVYQSADVIFHLGEYSKQLFEKQYPKAKHYITPHHIYNTVYTQFPSREEACRKLHLSASKKYILCFGTFRADVEREIVRFVAKNIKGYDILAPGFMDVPSYKRRFSWMPNRYEREILKLKYINGIHVIGKTWGAVSDDELPYYYAVADVCLIQRKKILNSGNVFLPMLFDKVVVGPDVGNVGQILTNSGYPVFDVSDNCSILESLNKAIILAKDNYPQKMHDLFLSKYSTQMVSQVLYNYYLEILR